MKQRIGLIIFLLALIFGFGLCVGFVLPRILRPGPPPRVYNTAAILQQVKTLSELVTVQYVIEKVVVLEVPPESLLGQMFAGESRDLMVAHGIVKGGIDLSR